MAWAGQRRGALTADGAWAGLACGSIVTAAGWDLAAGMLAFFLSGSTLSRLTRDGDDVLAGLWEKGSRRDAVQVLANGGVATILALIGIRYPSSGVAAAYFGSLAASSADTWATEIGALSKTPPRRIIDGRHVSPGMSGGVTPLGLLGSLAGAALLAGIAATSPSAGTLQRTTRFRIVVVAGLAGSLVDSLLGATVQACYYCPVCQSPTEQRVHRCGTRTRRDRGFTWFSNDVVNFVATAVGATLASACQVGTERTTGRHISR